MAVTIQQIAEKAGVSRGTVDRAINNRGRINPEVAERIKLIADELGYVPKHKKNKKNLKIGVITQLSKTPFMEEIHRGIYDAKEYLKMAGVKLILKDGESLDEIKQLEEIDHLVKEGIDALAIMPVDSGQIRIKINELIQQGILVVTFNSDLTGTDRKCFVGIDNKKSGQVAAGLMGMLTRGSGKILIITGFFSNPGNGARVDGFIEEVKKSYPDLEIAGVQCSFDDEKEVERIIRNTMLDVPGINGIFVVSGGQEGIGRAYEDLKLEKRPYTIIYDLTPGNVKILKKDIADFLIDQEGYVQGYEAPRILGDILLKNKEYEQEFYYTEINLKTKYNV